MLTSVLSTVASSWLKVDLFSKCSISSSRCSIGLKSCDWAVYCSKLNLLSCSWSRFWTILFMWHGVLPCWKNPSTAVLPCCYGCTWLATALCYPVALNHHISFIKGPNLCHREKRPHITLAQPDVWHDWCMYSCGFSSIPSLFISLEQQEPEFTCISNRLLECSCSIDHHSNLFSWKK